MYEGTIRSPRPGDKIDENRLWGSIVAVFRGGQDHKTGFGLSCAPFGQVVVVFSLCATAGAWLKQRSVNNHQHCCQTHEEGNFRRTKKKRSSLRFRLSRNEGAGPLVVVLFVTPVTPLCSMYNPEAVLVPGLLSSIPLSAALYPLILVG